MSSSRGCWQKVGPVAGEGFDCLTLLIAMQVHGFLTATLHPFRFAKSFKNVYVHFGGVGPQYVPAKLSADLP